MSYNNMYDINSTALAETDSNISGHQRARHSEIEGLQSVLCKRRPAADFSKVLSH